MANQIQFIGVNPDQFINDIVNKLKFAVIKELEERQTDKQTTYLTAQEVCEKFAISKPTVYAWRDRGVLKPYKLGSRIYYRLKDIENAMINDIP